MKNKLVLLALAGILTVTALFGCTQRQYEPVTNTSKELIAEDGWTKKGDHYTIYKSPDGQTQINYFNLRENYPSFSPRHR